MGNYRAISKEVREQVLNRIKNDGISVAVAAHDAGISTKTVYTWLSTVVEKEPGIIENNKLKRENQFLMLLVGKLTIEKEQNKQRGKK